MKYTNLLEHNTQHNMDDETRIRTNIARLLTKELKIRYEDYEDYSRGVRFLDAPVVMLDNGDVTRCRFCGVGVYSYRTRPAGSAGPTVVVGAYVNGALVCNDKRCRALAAYSNISNPIPAMLAILRKVTKNGNDAYKRRLAKHFIRHPR